MSELGSEVDPPWGQRAAQGVLPGTDGLSDLGCDLAERAESSRCWDCQPANQVTGDLGRAEQLHVHQRASGVQSFEQQRAVIWTGIQQPDRPMAVPGQQCLGLVGDVVLRPADLEHAPFVRALDGEDEVVVTVKCSLLKQLDPPPITQLLNQGGKSLKPATAIVPAPSNQAICECSGTETNPHPPGFPAVTMASVSLREVW